MYVLIISVILIVRLVEVIHPGNTVQHVSVILPVMIVR